MRDAAVEWDERLFPLALDSPARKGRLQMPRAESWQGPGERPCWLVEPRPFFGDE